jgi:uncharacterized protein YgiM (DUF1202 family)
LNIYQTASKTSKVIDKASKDSALPILDTLDSWYKVQVNNGKIGYSHKKYLKKLNPTNSENCGIVITQNNTLNIRKNPNQTSKVIGKASQGSALSILKTHGSSYEVKLNNGIIGFASRNLIKILK